MSKRTPISKEIRQQVLKRDGYRCRYCGSHSEVFHMDHVYPISKGGETTVNNLVTACPSCNIKKKDRVGVWPHDPDVATRIGEYETKKAYGTRLGWDIGILANVTAVLGVLLFAYSMEVKSSHLIIFSAGVMWIGIAVSVTMLWYERKTK